jgi:hypothetical protein
VIRTFRGLSNSRYKGEGMEEKAKVIADLRTAEKEAARVIGRNMVVTWDLMDLLTRAREALEATPEASR